MKNFSTVFVILYLLLSIPVIFGIGYEVGWDDHQPNWIEHTMAYIFMGLKVNMVINITISLIFGSVVCWLMSFLKRGTLFR